MKTRVSCPVHFRYSKENQCFRLAAKEQSLARDAGRFIIAFLPPMTWKVAEP